MKRKEKKELLSSFQLKNALNTICSEILNSFDSTGDNSFDTGFKTGVNCVLDTVNKSLSIYFNSKGVDFDECN